MVSLEDPWITGREWLAEIANRLKNDNEATETLTVRQFLAKFGYARRGWWFVSQIRNYLEELELRTEPDFQFEFIDDDISILLLPEIGGASTTDLENAGGATTDKPADRTHRIRSLAAAHNKPVRVTPDDLLSKATTLMRFNEFSQLPVMTSDFSVQGVISWKSIGYRLALGQDCKSVRDCMEQAQEISIDASLFEAISTIEAHGYVLVRDQNAITGIITASDLSHQFVQLASPFLRIGEIENHLRRLIHDKFTPDELKSASDPHDDREIGGPEDLTLGGMRRLLENRERWEKLSLKVDRSVFIEYLESVRRIRNDVMHFDPDGLDQKDTKVLFDFATFCEELANIGAI